MRTPREIPPYEFVLCCALASVVEPKRGFASVWRPLASAADAIVARSNVTRRFGSGSAKLMEELFALAVERLPQPSCPELLVKLDAFRAVLANDATLVMLSPLLKKIFPAARTNRVAAAGKVHATADVLARRIVGVQITGERTSDLSVARAQPIVPDTLYLEDLGYYSHDRLAAVHNGGAHGIGRLKDNADPRIVKVRHGICPEDIALGYQQRWVIESLFKLLKSSCHLDHVDTSDADALRTHLYASLLATTLLATITCAAATAYGLHPSEISALVVGIATPLSAIPLMFWLLERPLRPEELADCMPRVLASGCRDQNPGRTRAKRGSLSRN